MLAITGADRYRWRVNLEDHLGDIIRKARAMSGISAADAQCFQAAPLVHNADEGGLGLAALIVDVRIPQPAVLADMQIRAAVRTGIAAADLDADLHVEDLLVAARPAVVRHGESDTRELAVVPVDPGREHAHPRRKPT